MNHQYHWQVGQQLMCALCGKMDYHEGPEECSGTGAGKMLSLRDLDKRNGRESAPVLNDDMKIGHFGGIKPGDIVPSADIYESNWGETIAEAKNWFPACAYYDGGGYVFIDRSNKVVEQSEANSPRTWTFLKNGREYDGAARVDESLIQELERHLDKICAERDELMTENARLKARLRELEPEQPQPRLLYRWGRPV